MKCARCWWIVVWGVWVTGGVSGQESPVEPVVRDLVFCSPELQLVHPSLPLEVRLRMGQYTHNTYTGAWVGRQDLLVGWVSAHKNWRVFSYTQLDDAKRAWTGLRIDRNWTWPHHQLQLHLQYRAFVGLNTRSAPHQFGFGLCTYPLRPGLRAGVFGFAKDWWAASQTAQDYAFVGPMLQTKWSRQLSSLTGLGRDLTGHYRYLLMLRLAVRWEEGR